MQAAGSAPAVLAKRRTCRTPDGLGFSAHSYGLGFLGAAPYRAPRHRHATHIFGNASYMYPSLNATRILPHQYHVSCAVQLVRSVAPLL